jgi:L-lactate utilization protein LutB
MALLVDVVFGIKSFSEIPCLAWKCGTCRSDSPIVIHHAKVVVSQPNLGCCIPFCGFLVVI